MRKMSTIRHGTKKLLSAFKERRSVLGSSKSRSAVAHMQRKARKLHGTKKIVSWLS